LSTLNMTSSTTPTTKSFKERMFHALTFEAVAIAICAPAGALLLGHSLVHMGVLTLMISLAAMLWNIVFNAAFDRARQRLAFELTLVARAVHALLFELGLILAVVPLAAWWLSIGLWEAFVLDIGIALFFLPYTFVFNWSYDKLRERRLARRAARLLTAG
jgi:uncharacterized membrane protein